MSIKQLLSEMEVRMKARKLKCGSVVLLDGRLVEIFKIPNGVYDVPCRVCEFANRCSGLFLQVCTELKPDKENQYGLASVMKHK